MVKVSRHHNVPGSRGGSDSERNRSTLFNDRHNDFHQSFAKNYTVDEITRRVLYDAMRFDGKQTILERTARNIFHILRTRNWSRLYKPGTIFSVAIPSAVEKAERTSRFTREYLEEEAQLIESRMDAVVSSEGGQKSDFLKAFLLFFKTDSPIEALKKFYTEEHNGELSWTKAMDTKALHLVLRHLESVRIIEMTRGTRQKILTVLGTQQRSIQRSLKEWS